MRAAVLGSPIAHSLSPRLHTAAYAALGLDWRYDAVEVDAAGLPALVAGLGPQWAGLSLTMPLKEAVLPLLTATLGSDGWSSELEQIVYDVKDGGTSCRFELTAAQKAGAESRLRETGVSTDVLVPLP